MAVRYEREKKPVFDFFNIMKYLALYVVFSLVVFGVDKIVLNAIDMSPTKQVGNSYLTLYEVHNTGAAFNLFANQPDVIIFSSFIAVAAIAFIVLLFSGRLTQTLISGMALLSAGITMNMLARIKYTYVIDYISVNGANFPVFNAADIMIVFGAFGLVLALFSRD